MKEVELTVTMVYEVDEGWYDDPSDEAIETAEGHSTDMDIANLLMSKSGGATITGCTARIIKETEKNAE